MSESETLSSRLSDQPGRVVAVLVVAPYLVYRGTRCRDPVLVAIGAVLFAWDLFWIMCREPRRVAPR